MGMFPPQQKMLGVYRGEINGNCDTLGWQIFLLYPKVTIIPPFLKSLQPQEELNRTSNLSIDFGVKGDAGPWGS